MTNPFEINKARHVCVLRTYAVPNVENDRRAVPKEEFVIGENRFFAAGLRAAEKR